MTIKKEYSIGDIVWIHGISPSNKLTQGKLIATLDLSKEGYQELQYVIEIPSHIEPLLELRPWQTISQDEYGPVGSLREISQNLDSENKKIRQLGYIDAQSNRSNDEPDPTPDEIMAALEKSKDGLTHKPLQIKDNKPKRKYYPKRKKP